MELRVEVALDGALRGLLELLLADLDFGNFLVGGNHLVESVEVLVHDVADVVGGELQVLSFVVVGIDEGDELVVALYDDTLYDERHGVELVFYLFRIDVLSVGAKEHILDTAVDEDVAGIVHRAEVAGVVPSFAVEGLTGGLLVLVVAEHRVQSSGEDLARHVLRVGGADLHLHVVGRLAAGAGSEVVPVLVADDGCALGGAVADGS